MLPTRVRGQFLPGRGMLNLNSTRGGPSNGFAMRNTSYEGRRFPFDTRRRADGRIGGVSCLGGVPRPGVEARVGRGASANIKCCRSDRRDPRASRRDRGGPAARVGGGSGYTVTAEFQNSSQLVTGNNVDVAGVPVGSVKQISLSDNGQALVKMEISDSAYTPLPEGTHATSAPSRSRGSPTATSTSLCPPTPMARRSPPAGRSPRPTPPPRSTSTRSSTPSTSRPSIT